LNIALITSLIIFWGSYYYQNSQKNTLENKFTSLLQRSTQDSIKIDELKTTGVEQAKNINQLKQKNDSLIINIATVEGMLAGTDKKVEIGFSDNKFDLAQIKSKVGTTKKIITDEQKQYLIKELSKVKGFTVPIQFGSNSPLDADYAMQIKDIFMKAGIKTWTNSLIGGYTSNSTLKGIVFIGRDKNTITQEEEFVFQVFHKAKLNVMSGFDPKAEYKYSIYIGE